MTTTIHRTRVRNTCELLRRNRTFILHELIGEQWHTHHVKTERVVWESGYVNFGTLDQQKGMSFTFEQILDEPHLRYLTVAPLPGQRSFLPWSWWARVTERLMK